MDVAADRGEDDLPARGALHAVHELLEVGDRGLHGLGGEQDEGQLQLAAAEQVPDLRHAVEQVGVDDVERGLRLQRDIQVLDQADLLSLDDPPPQAAEDVLGGVAFLAASRLLGAELAGLPPTDGWGNSPILSVHLWHDREIRLPGVMALVGTRTQWLFDGPAGNPSYRNAVISAADDLVTWPAEKVVELVRRELAETVPAIGQARLVHARVIKARRATPVFGTRAATSRPPTATRLVNLWLAGDWIETGFPSTLEGAALSGHRAAQAIVAGRAGRG